MGRHAEAALVDVTLDQSTSGAPSALIVRGEPGIGKSRLLAEAVARATAKGHHVVWVRAEALESQVPFGALSVALDRAAAADPAFAPGAVALRGFIDGAPIGDPSSRLSFAQICDTLARTFIDAADLDPACVVIDDVHLLDQESLALLGVALGRVAGRNVAFVCSTRSPGHDLDSQAGELLARLAEWPDVADLELGPLDGDHVHELLEDVLASSVSRTVANTVTQQSRGNPLFVLEIARSLPALDVVDTGATGVVGSHDGTRLVHLSRHTAILQRLFPLTADARRVAQIVAALHRIRLGDLELVAELTGLDAAGVAAAFDELERRGIIVSDDDTWRLFHQFAADALHEDIGPAERRRIHRRVAEHLLHRRDAGEAVDVIRLARHVAASANVGDEAAARVLADAARSMKGTGPLSAAELAQQALSLLPPGAPQRGELLSLRTRCLILAGRPRDAVACGWDALDATAIGGEEHTRTATALIGALFDVGNVAEARGLAERVVSDGTASAFVLAQRAMLVAAQGDVAAARAAVHDALAARPRSAGEEVLVLSFVSSATLLIGDIATGVGQLDSLHRAALDAGANLCAYGLTRRAWSLVWSGFASAAAAVTEEADAALGAVGTGTYSAGMTSARIGIDWMTGDWDHALAGIASARRDVAMSDNAVIVRYLRDIEVEMRTTRGELRDALASIKDSTGTSPSTRTIWATAGVLSATGDAAGARRMLRGAIERPIDATWLPHALLRLLEMEHDAGDERSAEATLAELDAVCDPSRDPRPWAAAMALRGRAIVCRDPSAAIASAAVAEAEGLVYDAAVARSLAGRLDEAHTEELLAAHEVFGTLGAVADRRRMAAVLRERGAKVPRRRRRSAHELTPAEADIARLVQAGMRNGDIARTTNYSGRTIEVYLSRIYAKVGVSSRLQLARLLDEQDLQIDD